MPSLIATLGANISGFVRDLDSAKGHAKKGGEGIASALGGELAGKLGGLLSVAAIEQTIERTIEYGSKVNDLALRLGISTDAVQQWDFALKQNGSSIDAAVPFFEKLAVSRDKALKGNPELIEAYKKLGLTVSQLAGMRGNDIGAAISKAYQLGDPDALIGSLKAVGGKAAGEMAALFRDGLADALKSAPIISAEDIAKLDKAGDAIQRIGQTFLAVAAGPIASFTDAMEKTLVMTKAAALGTAALFTGGVGAGRSAAKEVMNEYLRQQDADRERREAQARRIKYGRSGLNDDDGTDKKKEVATADKQADAERHADEVHAKEVDKVKTVHEQIAEIQRKTSMEGKTESEKRRAIEAEIAALKKTHAQSIAYGGATDLELANEEKKIAELEAERAGHKDKILKGREITNNIQSSGFFVGALSQAPDVAMLDTQKKSEQHLARVDRNIELIARRSGQRITEADDSTFE